MTAPDRALPPVAIVGGTGSQGTGLALRWAAAGIAVVIGSRNAARAQAAAAAVAQRLAAAGYQERSHLVSGANNAVAVLSSRRVVLTVPFGAHASVLKELRPAWQAGTVLVDVTVPLAVAIGGPATQTVQPWAGSAAEQAAALVPEGVSVCAAFHHVSADALADLAAAVECDVLVCGDRKAAREALRPLVEAIPGLRFVEAGPLERARLVEPLTALLIGLNLRHKVRHSGIRLTGLPLPPPATR